MIVSVDDKGNISYEDESKSWANPEGTERTWYETFDTSYPLDFIDADTVADDAEQFFNIMIPYESGTYSISCDISLVYDVYYNEEITRFRDEDGDIGEDIDDSYVTDVVLDKDESEMTNFKCNKV